MILIMPKGKDDCRRSHLVAAGRAAISRSACAENISTEPATSSAVFTNVYVAQRHIRLTQTTGKLCTSITGNV